MMNIEIKSQLEFFSVPVLCCDISPSAAFMLCDLPKDKSSTLQNAVNQEQSKRVQFPQITNQGLNYQHVLCNLSSFTLLSPKFCVDRTKWDR